MNTIEVEFQRNNTIIINCNKQYAISNTTQKQYTQNQYKQGKQSNIVQKYCTVSSKYCMILHTMKEVQQKVTEFEKYSVHLIRHPEIYRGCCYVYIKAWHGSSSYYILPTVL